MTIHYKGSTRLSTKAKRTLLSVALGMCVVGGVQAQSSVGSLFGQAEPGATITIENPQTGTTRSITGDAAGRFTFSQLPPGTYKVTANGVTREVAVNVGTGTQVNFAASDASSLDTVTVTGNRAINPIDVSSVESTTVFTAEQLQNLPVASDVTNVALLAPGTVKGDGGFGNLASFGGSSVAENGYYINGFDVTNMRNMLSFANVPFQAIAQQQVKTGGYGAEYGRSMGGIISIVTRRGSNDWHFGGSAEFEPQSWRAKGKDVITRDAEARELGYDYLAFRSENQDDSLVYSAYASGPIVKDKLFFYAMLEGRDVTSDQFASETSRHTEDTSPHGLVKLDWYITDNHLLELTGIENTSKVKYTDYVYTSEYFGGQQFRGKHEEKSAEYEVEDGGHVGILKYTGYLTDNFTVSAQYGVLKNTVGYQTPELLPGGECAWAYDWGTTTTVTEDVGCFNPSQITIRDTEFGPDEDERKAWRLDAEWRLGDHLLRAGADFEKYTSGHAGQTYTGGENWAYYQVRSDETASGAYAGQPGRVVNNTLVAPGETYVRRRDYQTTSATYQNENRAFYLEDSWQVTDNFLTYLGLRWESFKNMNGDGVAWVDSGNKLAPRLGFSWDAMGDSTIKVFGNAGRYYIPVATNSSIRATGSEATLYQYWYTDLDPDTGKAYDPATGQPYQLGEKIGQDALNGSYEAPDPASVASANLSPMYQDEIILGAQVALSDTWTAGLRAIHRNAKSGMDDTCTKDPVAAWAEDQGLEDLDYSSIPPCYFINPGQDVIINIDTDGDGEVELAHIPASYYGMPEYKRSYRALEFFWERAGEKLYMQGSYTLGYSKGNTEGYVNSTLEQGDPGLTQDFDHVLFTHGTDGYTPNDRRHTLKAFGAYTFSPEWAVSGNLIIQSGRPVNCQGYLPVDELSDLDYNTFVPYGGSSYYCLEADGSRVLHNRGDQGRTPWTWTFDLGASYKPNWAGNKLKFKLDIYNLFNNDRVTEYDEATEASRDQFNPDYMNDMNYQSPRRARLTVRYDW